MDEVYKILIVDDNELTLLYMSKILSENNRIIITVSSGKEAIKKVVDNPDIALIIMDVQMPELDGFETVKEIKKFPFANKIPVIFNTGLYKTDTNVIKGHESGAYDYILKPIDSEIFKTKVNVFLGLYKQQKKLEDLSNYYLLQKNYMDKVVATIPSLIIVLDKESNIITTNFEQSLIKKKYPEISIDLFLEEINNVTNIITLDNTDLHAEIKLKYFKTEYLLYFEVIISSMKEDKNEYNTLLTITDITEKKLTELNYQSSNRSLKILYECNFTQIISNAENELLYAYCDIIVNSACYPFACISTANHNENNEIIGFSKKAYSGDYLEYYQNLDCEVINDIEVICPLRAQLNNPKILNYIFSENNSCKTCKNKSEFNSIISIPLIIENKFYALFNIYSMEKELLDKPEESLITEISRNLQFGLESIKTKEMRKKAEELIAVEKEELSLTLKSIADGVITSSFDGKIHLANIAACNILDIDINNINEYLIYDIVNIVNKDNKTALFNPIDWIPVYRELDDHRRQITIQTVKNNKKIISISVTEIKDTKNNFKGILLVFSDITERLRIENQQALSK